MPKDAQWVFTVGPQALKGTEFQFLQSSHLFGSETARIDIAIGRKHAFDGTIVGADEHNSIMLAFGDNVADRAKLDAAAIPTMGEQVAIRDHYRG